MKDSDSGKWGALFVGAHRAVESIPTVLAETRRRSDAAGLSHELLRELEDVDTLEAWERFLVSSRK